MTDRATDHLPLPPHLFEILVTLATGPAHGYRIVREVDERTDGRIALSTSTLYGGLRRLLREGLAEEAGDAVDDASGGPPRRYYRITPLGVEVAELETWWREERNVAEEGWATPRVLRAEPLGTRGTLIAVELRGG